LEEIGIIPPTDLTFAPIDFRTQTVQEGLRSAGFDPRKGTLFSWLGATEYVPTEAVMETLRFIVSAPVGSGVVFDYMISPSLLTGAQRTRFDFLAQYVASTGEPWQTFFGPESLVKDLRAMGFRYIEDYGQEEINARYFRDRTDGLQVGTLSHIMIARV
jgi:methyltransferase (TIGR00027 family)